MPEAVIGSLSIPMKILDAGFAAAERCGGALDRPLRHDKRPADLERDAMAAWRQFVSCMAQLPADQAALLGHMVHQTKTVADVAA